MSRINKIKFILALVLFSQSCFAQFLKQGKLIAEAGLNVATIQHNLPVTGLQPLFKYHYGLAIRQFLTTDNHLAIQFGAFISSKGYRQEIDKKSNTFNLEYLTFPLMLVWQPVDIVAIQIGLTGGVRYNARFTSQIGTRAIGKYYSNYDIGWLSGIHFLPGNKIGFYFRSNLGLYKLTEQPVFDHFGFPNGIMKQKNLVFQSGISFNLAEL